MANKGNRKQESAKKDKAVPDIKARRKLKEQKRKDKQK